MPRLKTRLLWWKEPILASCSFRGFLTYIRKAFSYVSWKPRNGQLAKMGSFHQSKRSDRKRCTMEVRWGIFFENFLFLKAVVNIPIQTVIIPHLISNGVCFSKIKIPYILTKPCHSLCPFSNLKFSFLRSCNSLETYNGKLMGSKTHTSLTRATNFPQLTHSLRDCLRGVMPFYFRNHENIHFTASIFLRQMVKILKTLIFVPNC